MFSRPARAGTECRSVAAVATCASWCDADRGFSLRGVSIKADPHFGLGVCKMLRRRAGDRTRTGDVQLGKLAFYH